MGAYVITIPGHAKGKQRARVTMRGGKARSYTPEQTVSAEGWVKQCCVDQVGSPCLEGPLSVRVGISVAIPQSWSKKKQASALSGVLQPTGRPDIDNTCKLLADALNGLLWKDDAQIVELTVRKSYAASPMTVLAVEAA